MTSLLLLLACTSKEVEDSAPAPLPACETPANLGWDPATEDEIRLSEADATWSSPDGAAFDAAAVEGCDTPPCLGFTGPGRVEASTILNRGVSYRLTGVYAGDAPATIRVDQALREGGRSSVLESTIEPGPVDLSFTILTAGTNTLLSIEAADGVSGTLDAFAVTGSQWALVSGPQPAPLRLGFLIHVEESGGFLTDPDLWSAEAQILAALSARLAAHGAILTIQPDVTFVRGAATFDATWIPARLAEGVAFSAHLHDESNGLEPFEASARDARRGFADQGVTLDDLNGGFEIAAWQTVENAGYRSISAFKRGETQLGLTQGYTTPWRVADGAGAADEAAFVTHDPDGPVVFVPGMGTREADTSRFVSYASRVLSQARVHTRPGFVNTWYFIDHIDAYGPAGEPETVQKWIDSGGLDEALEPYETLLTEVLDPLVASGEVVYGSPSTMAQAFLDWESTCAW